MAAGSTSGTYGVASTFTNAEILFEAYSRCGLRETELEVHHMADGRRSLNMSLQALVNRGVNLFLIEQNVIQLVASQATYPMPPEIVSIADAYFNTILATGPGPDFDAPYYDPSQPIAANDPQTIITQSSDRWLKPMGFADYARIPNKTLPGFPTRYWFNRLGPLQPTGITLWQPPAEGWPNVALTYFGIRMVQDSNLAGGELPDVAARFLDWLAADTAVRLARKYAPQLIGPPGAGGLRDEANEAWALASAEDTEKAEVKIQAGIHQYFRM